MLSTDGFKGSLGEGLLNWEVNTKQQKDEEKATSQPPRVPLLLPPPTTSDSTPGHAPMEQSHDTEEAESKAGVKRALSLSPQGESRGTDDNKMADSASSEVKPQQGPEIKRRNVAIYNTEPEGIGEKDE